MAKRIIHFLGYHPFDFTHASIGSPLYYARMIGGWTQQQVADYLKCDESNLRMIELGKRKPGKQLFDKINRFIQQSLPERT